MKIFKYLNEDNLEFLMRNKKPQLEYNNFLKNPMYFFKQWGLFLLELQPLLRMKFR